jgi:SAM-dependent methyltransferase
MGDDRVKLARTFDEVAELYDRARPSYPARVFDDLEELARLERGARVVETGPGTGQATRVLVERGYRVTAVEPGAELARVLRRNLPEVNVVVSTFEAWEPHETFDLVLAATSWHWVDPDVRYAKAAAVARALAVVGTQHVIPDDVDPFFIEIQEVYDEIGESFVGPPPRPEDDHSVRAEIDASGVWGRVETRTYVWVREYTAETYVDVLETYSGHRTMTDDQRAHLYAEIRRRVGDRTIRKHYKTTLDVALRA